MYHNKIRAGNGYYFLAFESDNLTATAESLADCLKEEVVCLEEISRRRL